MTGYAPSPRRRSPQGDGHYIIRVQGAVEPHWEPELRMRVVGVRLNDEIVSTLAGWLPDQSALLGALQRLHMWGYPILQVLYTSDGQGEPPQ